MDIFLSINNREKVIQLPVLPPEFMIQSPQDNEPYKTVAIGDINLIGNIGLKKISFSSTFPSKKVPYSKNNTMFGWDYVSEIETLRTRKLPFRLIITDTLINMAVTIDNFEYGLRSGTRDIQYSIEFSEFRFLEVK